MGAAVQLAPPGCRAVCVGLTLGRDARSAAAQEEGGRGEATAEAPMQDSGFGLADIFFFFNNRSYINP